MRFQRSVNNIITHLFSFNIDRKNVKFKMCSRSNRLTILNNISTEVSTLRKFDSDSAGAYINTVYTIWETANMSLVSFNLFRQYSTTVRVYTDKVCFTSEYVYIKLLTKPTHNQLVKVLQLMYVIDVVKLLKM